MINSHKGHLITKDTMKKFSDIYTLSPEEFLRTTGISKENFQYLLEQLKINIAQAKEKNPIKKRGQKGNFFLEDRLLLTLYYLRHYPTFLILGQFFGISESYANKIYHRISGILVKIIHVPNRKKLMDGDLETVIIDVCEQAVERPQEGQKHYYSGKKNSILSKSS